MLDLAVQKHKNEPRLYEPCPTKSEFYVHEHYASVGLSWGPAPEEACGENSSAVAKPRGNYICDHANPENAVGRQNSLTRSVYMAAL